MGDFPPLFPRAVPRYTAIPVAGEGQARGKPGRSLPAYAPLKVIIWRAQVPDWLWLAATL